MPLVVAGVWAKSAVPLSHKNKKARKLASAALRVVELLNRLRMLIFGLPLVTHRGWNVAPNRECEACHENASEGTKYDTGKEVGVGWENGGRQGTHGFYSKIATGIIG